MQVNTGLHNVPSFGDFLPRALGAQESQGGSGSLAKSQPISIPSGRLSSLRDPLAPSLSQPPARDSLGSGSLGAASVYLNLVGTPSSGKSFDTSASSLSFPVQETSPKLGAFFQEALEPSQQGDLSMRASLGGGVFAQAQRAQPSKPVSLLSQSLQQGTSSNLVNSSAASEVPLPPSRGASRSFDRGANVFLQSKAYWVPNSLGGIRFDEAAHQRQTARWESCLGEVQTALTLSDFHMDELAGILDSGFFETRIAGREVEQETLYGVLNTVVDDLKSDLAGSRNMADVGRALLNVVNSRLQ